MHLSLAVADLLGATVVAELGGGHQARVFEVRDADGGRSVAKVLDASMVDAAEATERVEAVAALARLDPRVCRPIAVDDALVARCEIEGRSYLVTRYEYAQGTAVDPAVDDDARLMGVGLAQLHLALRGVGRRALPIVAALRAAGAADDGSFQLLHGDFNHDNVRRHAGGLRIFDFDDSGYGPVAFDVANALYMVLFASMVTDDRIRYRSFEASFLDGYGAEADRAIDPTAVRSFLDARVRALRAWLRDPGAAPVGIRTATPAWHQVLRDFVRRYESGGR